MNNPLTTLREEMYEAYGEISGLEKHELAGAYTIFIDLAISRTLDLVSEEMGKMKCSVCNGDGFYADHAPMSEHNPETGECLYCPVQAGCETCKGTGLLYADFLSRIQELKTEKST